MHQHYDDILSRIAEPPLWFDENGVPRYSAFHPDKLANIYAKECALLEISCQECGHKFLVSIDTRKALSHANDYRPTGPNFVLADLIRSNKVHYGDPPNIHCCSAGSTMNSIPLRVVEYWHRMQTTHTKPGSTHKFISPASLAWTRDNNLEIVIDRALKRLN